MFHFAVMIAQNFDFPEDFLKERRIGDYGRLRKIRWNIKRPARARRIYETSGLTGMVDAHGASGLLLGFFCGLFFFLRHRGFLFGLFGVSLFFAHAICSCPVMNNCISSIADFALCSLPEAAYSSYPDQPGKESI
jgi:hypothetical protein